MRLASGANTRFALVLLLSWGAAMAAGVPPRETDIKHWQHTCARPGLLDSGRRGFGLHAGSVPELTPSGGIKLNRRVQFTKSHSFDTIFRRTRADRGA